MLRSVNVRRVFECKETYEGFCKYAMNVFARRRMNVRQMYMYGVVKSQKGSRAVTWRFSAGCGE